MPKNKLLKLKKWWTRGRIIGISITTTICLGLGSWAIVDIAKTNRFDINVPQMAENFYNSSTLEKWVNEKISRATTVLTATSFEVGTTNYITNNNTIASEDNLGITKNLFQNQFWLTPITSGDNYLIYDYLTNQNTNYDTLTPSIATTLFADSYQETVVHTYQIFIDRITKLTSFTQLPTSTSVDELLREAAKQLEFNEEQLTVYQEINALFAEISK